MTWVVTRPYPDGRRRVHDGPRYLHEMTLPGADGKSAWSSGGAEEPACAMPGKMTLEEAIAGAFWSYASPEKRLPLPAITRLDESGARLEWSTVQHAAELRMYPDGTCEWWWRDRVTEEARGSTAPEAGGLPLILFELLARGAEGGTEAVTPRVPFPTVTPRVPFPRDGLADHEGRDPTRESPTKKAPRTP